ncbi:RNA polymerase sigma factor [Sphingomonas canadensis]|uniref:RNA polymerase sigma factor n=1 Tax=Sphingomonas canadensis TaxID=1219257 RepID=A0ABW3H7E4_9SPHN|nr:sigma-70 family RNA polymerase sigma factor [Sphingomonas canadensis]MCW3837042.1 sigma-70 family RNA polymerase sigma factor [Sphingomonas canadensis]
MQDKPNQDARYTAAARSYGAAIERLARGYEADPELRRDLVQEIHAALWRSFGYFEGQCSERSWVYRVAHNVAVTHVTMRRRLRAEALSGLDEIADIPGPADTEAQTGDRRIVDRLLATIHRLKPADRQVMLLYLEDLTAAEIGEVTGLSPGAVAVRIHRTKALLAQRFDRKELP